ncbi:MAG: hypothetical protein HQM02_09870 [Magnetococcales bacterium]|nr:hypothetical protein [Magnetococcales bacterium]
MIFYVLLFGCYFSGMLRSHAADDPSWSSGQYRLDPGRNPFQTPAEQAQPSIRDPWWDQERPPGAYQERFAPRIWEKDTTHPPPSTRKYRPWGEIPSQWDTPAPSGRARPAHPGERSTLDEERPSPYEERNVQRYQAPRGHPLDDEVSEPRDRSWDGPYQRDESRERYFRERYDRYRGAPESGYRDHPEWNPWSGRRYRQDSWDPWDREPPLSPWER